MSKRLDLETANVYVNLDRNLPFLLKLKPGENLIFLRNLDSAGNFLLHSLKMPEPYFVTAHDIPHGTKIPGQPEFTYVLALAKANASGKGEIEIRFELEQGCATRTIRKSLPFVISA